MRLDSNDPALTIFLSLLIIGKESFFLSFTFFITFKTVFFDSLGFFIIFGFLGFLDFLLCLSFFFFGIGSSGDAWGVLEGETEGISEGVSEGVSVVNTCKTGSDTTAEGIVIFTASIVASLTMVWRSANVKPTGDVGDCVGDCIVPGGRIPGDGVGADVKSAFFMVRVTTSITIEVLVLWRRLLPSASDWQ